MFRILATLALLLVPGAVAAQTTTVTVNGQVFQVQPGMQQTIMVGADGPMVVSETRIASTNAVAWSPPRQMPHIEYQDPDADYNTHPPQMPTPGGRREPDARFPDPDLAETGYAPARDAGYRTADQSDFGGGGVLRIKRDGRSGHFIVPIIMNGVQVKAIVDTGASGTILSPEDAAATGADRDVTYARPGVGIGGATTLYATRVRSLEIGGQRIKGFAADIGQRGIPYTLLGQPEIAKLGRIVIEDGVMTIYPKGVQMASR